MNTGLKMREIRKRKGLTQKQLQKATGIDAATLRKYENGQYIAKISTLGRIAEVLGVDPDALIMANMNTSKAMHALFTMYEEFGGNLITYDYVTDEIDQYGNYITEKRVAISFDDLNDYIVEWKIYLDKYSEDQDELKWVQDRFPMSFAIGEIGKSSEETKNIVNSPDTFKEKILCIFNDMELSEEEKEQLVDEEIAKLFKNTNKTE